MTLLSVSRGSKIARSDSVVDCEVQVQVAVSGDGKDVSFSFPWEWDWEWERVILYLFESRLPISTPPHTHLRTATRNSLRYLGS